MKMPSVISLVVVSALAAGCARTPPIPPNFDFVRATIVAGDKSPEVDIDGLSGKGSGAAVGGASGAGAGVVYAAIGCLPAAMFYGACLAAAVPLLGGIGAVGGATVGAVVTQSTASVEEKREMLNEALAAIDARNYLATLIREQVQEGNSAVPLVSNTGSAPVPPDWTMRIALNEVSTDTQGGSGNPYYLLASASLEVMQTGQVEPASRKEYHAQTKEKKTTDEWLSNEEEPVPTVIEYLLTALVSDMLKDVLPNQMSQGYQREVRPLYAKLKPKEAKPGSTALLDPKQITDSNVLQSGHHENEANTKNAQDETMKKAEIAQFVPGDKVSIVFKNGDTQNITITHMDERFVVGSHFYSLGQSTGVSYDRRDIRSIEYVK